MTTDGDVREAARPRLSIPSRLDLALDNASLVAGCAARLSVERMQAIAIAHRRLVTRLPQWTQIALAVPPSPRPNSAQPKRIPGRSP